MSLCIYVAGAYDGPDVHKIQGNMRRGLQLGYMLLKSGFAPFIPWLDFTLGLLGEITREEYLDYAMTWMMRCDAILVVREGWERSRGTLVEVAYAKSESVPIFWSFEELKEWSHGKE